MGKHGKRNEKREEIQVLYALVDKRGSFSKMAGASICSLFENTRDRVAVHIFHDGSIQGQNLERFEQLAEQYGQRILFYNVRALLPEVWKEAKEIFEAALQSSQYTEATLYRLVAPQVLPKSVGRLIYIDADTIVHIDIRKLWEEPIGPNGMAAVRESTILLHYGMTGIGGSAEPMYNRMKDSGLTMENCFNAGILLMDLHVIRPMGNLLLSGLRVLAKYPEENRFYDQNILNYYFAKDLAPLPWKYNILQHWDREHAGPREEEGIYHYMGKTLGMNGYDIRDTLFYSYFIKTPWCDGEFFCRIHGVMNQVYLQMIGPKLRWMRRLTALLATRRLVVAYSEEYARFAKQLFADPDSFDMDPKKEKKRSSASPVDLGKATVGAMEPGTVPVTDPKGGPPIQVNLSPANEPPEAAKPSSGEKATGKEGDEEKKAPKEKVYEFPEGVRQVSLGSEKEGLQFRLPYDVDEYFYLLFVGDYKRAKAILEHAGLPEREHYMDGTFLLAGKPWLEGLIKPQRFFEML